MTAPASDTTDDDPFLAAAVAVAVLAAVIVSVAVAALVGRGPAEVVTETSTTTTTAPVTVPPTTSPRLPQPVGVSVVWSDDGSAEIRGTVQSDDQFEAITSASIGAFGADNVDATRLRVVDEGGVDADERIGAFVAILGRMPSRLTQGTALLQDSRLSLSGTLAPGFGPDAFDDLLAAATEADIAVSTDLTAVAELEAFDRLVEVTEDGVLLTGTIASAEQAADLAAMLSALGLGEVVDDLVVTDVSPTEGTVSLVGEVDQETAAALQGMVAGDGIDIRDQLTVVSAEADAVERLNELFSLEPVLFDTAQATIREESAATLDRAAAILSEVDGAAVRIEGHTDSQGDPDRNLELSQQRAQAVLDELVLRGVDPAVLEAQGFGESRPIADNTTAEGRQANRRIEFTLLGA